MGCATSKSAAAEQPAVGGTKPTTEQLKQAQEQPDVPFNSPPRKPSPNFLRGGSDEIEGRRSVAYQAPEMESERNSLFMRRSSAPFDPAHIGTHTRHGIAPAGGSVKAKINQDRGLVCWPFNGSYNEALLAVFDGHGPKGEKVSEFCMQTIPVLVEERSEQLKTDVEGTLDSSVKEMETKLFAGSLSRLAMNAGTTSSVIYMRDDMCWVACSGDSRAIKGSRVGGKIVATDMSRDHKPDLPEEMERILQAGGEVSKAGPDGLPPSRVWAHGRVGLAMSRSIGDGEAKTCGVIPDPEIQKFSLTPPTSKDGDGDLFVIVASDGVWEFISSQQAAELVASHRHATDACTQLVKQAEAEWKRVEGSYRDDITCVITYLPFLQPDWDSEEVPDAGGEVEDEHNPDDSTIFVNAGVSGISRYESRLLARNSQAASSEGDGDEPAKNAEDEEEAQQKFIARRLSVYKPFDPEDVDPAAGMAA